MQSLKGSSPQALKADLPPWQWLCETGLQTLVSELLHSQQSSSLGGFSRLETRWPPAGVRGQDHGTGLTHNLLFNWSRQKGFGSSQGRKRKLDLLYGPARWDRTTVASYPSFLPSGLHPFSVILAPSPPPPPTGGWVRVWTEWQTTD